MLFQVVPENIFLQTVPRLRVERRPPQFGRDLLHDYILPLTNRYNEGCTRRQSCPRREGWTSCCQPRPGYSMKKNEVSPSRIATLDFRGFAPGEIKVKVTDKNILIHGHHEDSSGSYQVKRSVPLPPGADKTGVVCRYEDGLVKLELPPMKPLLKREVKQERTGSTVDQKESESTRNEGAKKMTDEDKEAREALERNLSQLAGLFSSMFGLPLCLNNSGKGSEEKSEEKAAEKTYDAKTDEERKQSDAKADDDAEGDSEGEEKQSANQAENAAAEGKETLPEKDVTPTNDEQETCCLTYDSKLPLECHFETTEQTTNENREVSDFAEIIPHEDKQEAESLVATDDLEDHVHSVDNISEPDSFIIMDVTHKKPDFQTSFDLSSYQPEDIRVTLRDGEVAVEAEHVTDEGGYLQVEKLSKSIRLPRNVDVSGLKSVLNSEGRLTLSAPFLSEEESEPPKDIPVVLTG